MEPVFRQHHTAHTALYHLPEPLFRLILILEKWKTVSQKHKTTISLKMLNNYKKVKVASSIAFERFATLLYILQCIKKEMAATCSSVFQIKFLQLPNNIHHIHILHFSWYDFYDFWILYSQQPQIIFIRNTLIRLDIISLVMLNKK